MKRWNGWGEEAINYPLHSSAAQFLAGQIGEGAHLEDVLFGRVLADVGPSRLPHHPLISTDPEERLRHARGQSLPDWIAFRSGQIGTFPDGVAYPVSDEEVRILLDLARRTGLKVIPYGGGTSVVGHINPLPGEAPILTIDLSHMNRLLSLDETSHLATFEAGVVGPEIEKQLYARGYTLGHFPQSFEFSTLGGWIATRSSGQQSYHYGRIENLFAGGHVETPIGAIDFPTHPASAAGPDLKQIFLGSEGRLGVVTRATVRVQPAPEFEAFYGVFFPDWAQGACAVRSIAQAGICVSMMRLSDAVETTTTLAQSGKDDLVRWARHGLRIAGYGSKPCLLIIGVTGTRRKALHARSEALDIIRAYKGLMTGPMIGNIWKKSRFFSAYVRNTLWESGYVSDTLETAVPWVNVLGTAQDLLADIRKGLESVNERVLVFAHLSHVYHDGASVYITYLFRRAKDPEETLHRYRTLKGAASRVIVTHGGTITHQHGIGLDHAEYLPAEKGPLGMRTLQTLTRLYDPDGMINPGKLLKEMTSETSW